MLNGGRVGACDELSMRGKNESVDADITMYANIRSRERQIHCSRTSLRHGVVMIEAEVRGLLTSSVHWSLTVLSGE